ncbi:MAG: TIGR00730 family Rossman fold protein [Hyphomicrobium sp.]
MHNTRNTLPPAASTSTVGTTKKRVASKTRQKSAVRNVCVYCGSGKGTNPAYAAAARVLGTALAKHDIGLVYGAGGLGLMGEVARATLDAGGRVTGIIPSFLSDKEQMLREASELIVTADMHERKKIMFERSDAFVALPGGIGTLEELVEQLTWSQLGRHTKPIVVANIAGFWSPFLNLLGHMKSEAFIRTGLDVSFRVVDEASKIVPAVLAAPAPAGDFDPALAVLAKF